MTLENVQKIFKKIREYTDYIYLHVKGEPLLHPQLKEILDLANENNLQVTITTNGTLLKNNVGILSSSKAIRQINVSLHSIEQNPELNIDKKRYFDELFDSVEKITRENSCYISYRLWNLDNINKYEKDIEILNYLKAYYDIPNLLQLIENKDFLKIKDKKYINLDTIYEWPSLKKKTISTKGKCYGLTNQIAILVDGTVVPCCLDQNGDINLGNIFEEDLDKILNSKLAIEIENGFKNGNLVHKLCQKCGFREVKRK